MSENNLYDILDTSPYASQELIRQKYRLLVKKYHPDLHPGDKHAEEMMEQVNAAYDVLGNPEERKQYDLELRLKTQETTKNVSPQPVPTTKVSGDNWQAFYESEKERVEATEAMWEEMKAKDRDDGNLFGNSIWADFPEKPISELHGWALAGRILLLIIKIIISFIFILLRIVNRNIDDDDSNGFFG